MLSKGIIYYTDNRLDPLIADKVKRNLREIADKRVLPIVCSSLEKMTFGDTNIYFPRLKRSIVTMFKQILGALENSDSDIIFFCEHDVLYPACHFDFTPPRTDRYYYNEHVWKMEVGDTTAMRHYCSQTSGLCAYRETLLTHYRKRMAMIEENFKKGGGHKGKEVKYDGYRKSMGFEPGKRTITHFEGMPNEHNHYIKGRIDDIRARTWKSKIPLIDIKHKNCLTANYWQLTTYRNRHYLPGYLISDTIDGWGKVVNII